MTATAPDTAAPAPLPKVADHPRLKAAQATEARLAGEVQKLEHGLTRYQELQEESLRAQRDIARRLVNGESLANVRTVSTDGVLDTILRDLRHARQGLELAKVQREQVGREVARELAEKFGPQFRERMRVYALEYIRFAQTMSEYREFVDDLRVHELLTGPVSNLLPGFSADDPYSIDGRFPQIARDLIDAGVLDERDDADLLRGLSVAPKFIPAVSPPPPPPKQPTEEGRKFGRALRRLGVQFGLAGQA